MDAEWQLDASMARTKVHHSMFTRVQTARTPIVATWLVFLAFGGSLAGCTPIGGSAVASNTSVEVSGYGSSSLNIQHLIPGATYLNIEGSCTEGGQIKIYAQTQGGTSAFALGNCEIRSGLSKRPTWSYSISVSDLSSPTLTWFISKTSRWRMIISGTSGAASRSRFTELPAPTTTTTVPVPQNAPGCTAAQLNVGITNTTVTSGDQLAYLDVANISQSPCSLVGTPIIVGLSTSGASTTFTPATPQSDVSMPIRFKNQNSPPRSPSRVVLEKGIQSADSIIDSDANCVSNQPNATVTYTQLSISLPGVSGNFTIPTTAFHDGSIKLGIQSCPYGSPSFSSVQVPPRYSFLVPSQSLIS